MSEILKEYIPYPMSESLYLFILDKRMFSIQNKKNIFNLALN